MGKSDVWQEAIELAQQRADTYRLFASVFDKEVNSQSAAQIAALGSAMDADDAEGAGERMAASGFSGMAASVEGFDADRETELAVDYARVFLNAGRNEGQAAIPFESYYTSEEHLLMQDARDEVRALYRQANLMPPKSGDMGGDVPDDYVVFELSFMALLNERTAEALAEGDRARAAELAATARDFRTEHLADWSDDFTRDIVETAHTDFYRYFAKAYRGFLLTEAEDAAELADLLSADGNAAQDAA